jgi:hypothetical protein
VSKSDGIHVVRAGHFDGLSEDDDVVQDCLRRQASIFAQQNKKIFSFVLV